MSLNRSFLTATMGIAFALGSYAQSDNQPQIFAPVAGQSTVINRMSNDGCWAVSSKASTTDGDINTIGAVLYNLVNTSEQIDISSTSGLCGANDVSDGAKVVVGSTEMVPAYWTRSTATWQKLPVPTGYKYGQLLAVTPDGHYAVGVANPDNEMEATPVMYDLTTNQLLTLSNLPQYDKTGASQKQNWFMDISADGRYVLGVISYSYMGETATYVYDRQTQTYDYLGMTISKKSLSSSSTWSPKVSGLFFVDNGQMSPTGKFVTGDAYMVKEVEGSDFGDEYRATYLYNVETKEFTVYDANGESDFSGFSVDDEGVVYASSPAENPYSFGYVRHGKYYYSIEEIFRSAWNMDINARMGSDNSGKPIAISTDGKTLALMTSPYDTYIVRVPKRLSTLCEDIDLLGTYTATPAAGSSFSYLTDVKLNFSRQIQLVGNPANIKLLDSNGQQVRAALGCEVDKTTATISFRGTQLELGKAYTVSIPAGMFCVNGDRDAKSRAITIAYTGRGTAPVVLTEAYPADGASFATIDINTNPIILTFDAQVAIKDGATAAFNRVGQDGGKVSDLYLAASGNRVMVYPLAGQHLYAELDYQVVIPAGSITDISGNGGNAEIVLNYTGTYVNEVPSDTRYLFNEDCNNYDNWIRYDGDELTPAAVPASWGFVPLSAWQVVMSDEGAVDMAFGSHSMYTPAGKANDWIITHQLSIPDDKTYLRFDSQSYLNSAKDVLKVIVLATDDIYQQPVNASIIDKFETEGDVVYNELQSPGSSEEALEGDWRNNTISLSKYKGKNIYIAFVNQNENQSAIFIDNIQVVREVLFTYNITSKSRVVNQTSATIAGTLAVTAEGGPYSNLSLTLRDAKGEAVSTLTAPETSIANGYVWNFSFPNPLTLETAAVNDYTIDVTLDGETGVIVGSVKNLTFEPIQKVVLEEFTGSGCSNCPLGIRAIENLQSVYGDRFIPITIRTYGSDMLGTGMTGYSSFLGLSAAPSGRINRGIISSPTISLGDGHFTFSGEGVTVSDGSDPRLWLDHAQAEFEQGTDLQVTVSGSSYNDATREFTADVVVKAAINLANQNVNLFTVVTEDRLESYQENGVYGYSDPILGEWGAGGSLGTQFVMYTFDDVARATIGATYNGTGGLVPATLEAGREYTAKIKGTLPDHVSVPSNCRLNVLAIDGNTNRMLTAERVKLGEGTGSVDDIVAGDANVSVYNNGAGQIMVNANGQKFTAQVYAADGVLLASANGADVAKVSVPAHGIVIVRVSTANGVYVHKLKL